MKNIYANGIIFKKPLPQAPPFVKGKIGINVEEFTKFMQEHITNGWVNIDLLYSEQREQEGKNPYSFTLNQWTKSKAEQEKELPVIDRTEINGVPMSELGKETNESFPEDTGGWDGKPQNKSNFN